MTKRHIWTDAEIDFVKSAYATMSAPEIAEKLGIKGSVVASKVYYLGIRKPKRKHTFENGIEGKICRKCKEWKPLAEYYVSDNYVDGYRSKCRVCTIITSSQNYKENFENQRPRRLAYNKTPERRAAKRKSAKTPEGKAYQREHYRERYKNDSEYRVRMNLRSRVYIALKKGRGEKSVHTLDLLDCTITKFKLHLQSQFKPGMTWQNYGRIEGIDTWEVDHIRPCASFDLTDPQQQKECFHYTNLQPLWASENRCKSDSWEK